MVHLCMCLLGHSRTMHAGYEHRLINNYNDKPILTRPQHRFYRGEHYCEIDVDVHNYAYLARKVGGGNAAVW